MGDDDIEAELKAMFEGIAADDDEAVGLHGIKVLTIFIEANRRQATALERIEQALVDRNVIEMERDRRS